MYYTNGLFFKILILKTLVFVSILITLKKLMGIHIHVVDSRFTYLLGKCSLQDKESFIYKYFSL